MYMNAAFDNVCFKGSVVSQSARFVYLCLCKHADNTNQTCFPSLNRIAEIVGKSISTIKRAVRELCKFGAIERTPRFRKDGGQTSNLYKIKECDFNVCIEKTEIEYETISFEENDKENISFPVSSDLQVASACMADLTESSNKVDEINIYENNIHLNINDLVDEKATVTTDPETTYINNSAITENFYSRKAPLKSYVNNAISWAKGLKYHLHIIKSRQFEKNELGGGHERPPKNLTN